MIPKLSDELYGAQGVVSVCACLETGTNQTDGPLSLSRIEPPMQKLPWSFRLRQAWELIVHGTDTRYDQALTVIEEQGNECARLEARLDAVGIDRKLYRLTLEKVQDYARGTDNMLHALVTDTLNPEYSRDPK